MSKRLILLTLLTFTKVAAAQELPPFIGDYNVGAGIFGSTESTSGTDSTNIGTIGVVGNGEGVYMEDVKFTSEQQHLIVVDGRFLNFIGVGAGQQGTTSAGALFALKLVGSFSAGVQAYQVIPLNLSVEDMELKINTGSGTNQLKGHALTGTTIYVPISLMAKMKATNMYAAMTIGYRSNSDLRESSPAVQAKIRYIRDKFSAEGRYLFTIGNDNVDEKRGTVLLGLNHLFGIKGNQIGLMLTKGSVTDNVTHQSMDINEGLLFYGGDL